MAQPARQRLQRSRTRERESPAFPPCRQLLSVARRCCRAFRGRGGGRAIPPRAPIAARCECRGRDTRRSPSRSRADPSGGPPDPRRRLRLSDRRASRRQHSADTRQNAPRGRWHVVALESPGIAPDTGPTGHYAGRFKEVHREESSGRPGQHPALGQQRSGAIEAADPFRGLANGRGDPDADRAPARSPFPNRDRT